KFFRSSGSDDVMFDGGGWVMVIIIQGDFLILFVILPESYKEKLIELLKCKNEIYKDSFQNMLSSQKRLINQ
ncbi:hypothetical protein ACSMCS_23320, partial [Salmonella enterica]